MAFPLASPRRCERHLLPRPHYRLRLIVSGVPVALAVQVFLTLSSSDPDPCGAFVFCHLVPVSEEPVVCALPPPPTTQGDMKNDCQVDKLFWTH